MVYANKSDRRADQVAQLRRILTGDEGIDRVYGPDEFSALGLPTRATNDQAPDLVLAATPDYAFGSESDGNYVTEGGDAGTHGYINTDPKMQAIFIAWGVGIPEGRQVRHHLESRCGTHHRSACWDSRWSTFKDT